MKPVQHKESNIVRLAVQIEPQTYSEGTRSVEMQFYTGATVDRYDWRTGEKYKLRLGLDAGQCDIAKLDGGPLLDTHMDYSVENVLGVITNPRIEAGKALATAVFSDDEDSMEILQKVKNGTLRKVSVGAVILHLSKESEDEEGMATYVADKWYPREVSIVPIPADPDAGFLADQLPIEKLMDQPEALGATAHEVTQMKEDLKTSPPVGTETRVDENAIRAAALKEERERAGEITKVVTKAGLPVSLAAELIDSGVSLSDARARVIDEIFAASQKANNETRSQSSAPTSTVVDVDARDKFRSAMESALLNRHDPHNHKVTGDNPYRSMSLIRMAEESITIAGGSAKGATPFELATAGLGLRVERLSGVHGTSDFPLILANVANKSLRAAYEAYPQTWRPFSRGTTMNDFKTKFINQLSEMATLQKINAAGEFKYVSLSERRESYALSTYGNIIAINRQTIINDDLGAFTRVPQLQGRAAAQLESDIVWALITSNPTMGADGIALFAAGHGNLAGAGAVINQTTLGAARAAMRVQKNVGGIETINVQPRYLLVPAAIETVALQQTSQQFTPQQGSNINTFRNLEVIVEPRLDTASTTAWYLSADPGQIDIIEYAYLSGNEGVYTETRMGFEVDGMEMKVRQDFGAQVLDWRGLYRNPGA